MARNTGLDGEDKARLLRALAFEIRRKRAGDEVLREHIDQQYALGRRREIRAADEALSERGFAAGLVALDLIGAEAAVVVAAIVEGKDHRVLAAALNDLADFIEG